MVPTGIIAFREFFEAFLLVGIFLGISKKLSLGRGKDILLASFAGFSFAISLSIITYFFADFARGILSHENSELLESYLMVFSGCFIAYVVFSLHGILSKSKGGKILKAHKELETKEFDLSLFMMIALLVAREGVEIALFTATSSLFAGFVQNLTGLVLGFIGAGFIGMLSYFSYVKFPIKKVFKATEYMIILLGAALVQNGLTELIEQTLHVELGNILRLPLSFLPSNESLFGHLLQTFVGLDRELSLPRIGIMIGYFLIVYFIFLRRRKSFITVKGN